MRHVSRSLVLVLTVLIVAAWGADAFAGGKKGSGGDVSVKGYYRKDGTYVQPHKRSAPDSSPYNNYGMPGNYNPNTGTITPGKPDTYLEQIPKAAPAAPSRAKDPDCRTVRGTDGSETVICGNR